MPMDPNADIEISAYSWVPPLAHGQVRDLRPRWALEEIGLSYRTRLMDVRDKPDDYFHDQPFGQVPAYREGDIRMFECGAIALHIAEKDERLLPRDPVARARAITWLFAALNSFDPMFVTLAIARFHGEEKGWATGVCEAVLPMLDKRLGQLAGVLGDKEWLEGTFTVGDLMMVATLRSFNRNIVTLPDSIADYVARGEARPAFKVAMAAQMADFVPEEKGVPA